MDKTRYTAVPWICQLPQFVPAIKENDAQPKDQMQGLKEELILI